MITSAKIRRKELYLRSVYSSPTSVLWSYSEDSRLMQRAGERSSFLVPMTPAGKYNSNDITASSFLELAAACLPPTSGRGPWPRRRTSSQGHGWICLPLCETTVVGSSSTKN